MNSCTHLIIIKDIYPEGKNGADRLLFSCWAVPLFDFATSAAYKLRKQMLWMFLSS